MPYQSPLDSSKYIRVTGKNEGIDGNGHRYHIERKHYFEGAPLLFMAFSFGFLVILLSSCGLIEPSELAPTPAQLEQRSEF